MRIKVIQRIKSVGLKHVDNLSWKRKGVFNNKSTNLVDSLVDDIRNPQVKDEQDKKRLMVSTIAFSVLVSVLILLSTSVAFKWI
jgi:hypothetical protein